MDRLHSGTPRQHLILGRLNWGGIAFGAMAGLGAAAALSVVLFALGLRLGESPGADTAFAMVQFLGLMAAGYVSGRFAPGTPAHQVAHGALAGLVLFAASAAIALATGRDIGFAAVVGGGVVALVLGSVGAVVAVRR